MNMVIRQEQESDYKNVELLLREAFWNLYFPGCDEHYTAHLIRQHQDFIPELSMIIEIDNQLAGVIFYTRSYVVDKEGRQFPTITFGPVAIHPTFQGQGLGRKLIMFSIAKAKELKFEMIIIMGYPYHYKPYGFEGTKKFDISLPDGKFYTGVMALPLQEDYQHLKGTLYTSPVFESITPEGLEQFDKQFPFKEKLTTPSQINFEKAVVEIDNNIY